MAGLVRIIYKWALALTVKLVLVDKVLVFFSECDLFMVLLLLIDVNSHFFNY